jgi:hypothetical protein
MCGYIKLICSLRSFTPEPITFEISDWDVCPARKGRSDLDSLRFQEVLEITSQSE